MRCTQARPSANLRRMMAVTFAAALACCIAPAAARAQNAYITNSGSNTVSVIDTATNTLVGSPIAVGNLPYGVAVTPDGRRVYVANYYSNTVSVIDTATNAVVGTRIPVGVSPAAFGQFIQPTKAKFAGKPGKKSCIGQSASALARRYGGLGAATRALGYANVPTIRAAIRSYCEG
jgi:YVTN family beta-propeller protein